MSSGYVHGYDPREAERLQDQAGTLVELLHGDTSYPAGSCILEVGCGVGAQTLTLARNSPGARITSVDVSEASLAQARRQADAAGLTNVQFQRADVFALPYEPASFDHVFVCFVLEHLVRPMEALRALRTVLRPGGTITVIEGDHGSAYFHPDSEAANAAIRSLVALQRAAGGNAMIGRELYPLLTTAGFTHARVSPRMVYVDSSKPKLVDGFTKKTFTAMIEAVREAALDARLVDAEVFDKGIHDLYATAGSNGVFCYTFFKAIAKRGAVDNRSERTRQGLDEASPLDRLLRGRTKRRGIVTSEIALPRDGKMKAVVQVRYGSPDGLDLREIDKPAVGDDGVLVRVRGASVNAYDWHAMRRLAHIISRLLGRPMPQVRGADLAGHVEAVGRNVTRFKPGDEVFGVGRGSFAEYATTSEDHLAAKPRNLTFEQAAALAVAGCTALQGLRDKGQVKAGQRVLVHGAGGGVGTFAVQIARSLGAQVTAVTSTGNVELLHSIGANEVIDYAKEDFTECGQTYDVLFDVGANRSSADCQRVLAPNGRFVLCGAPSGLWATLSLLLKAQLTWRSGSRRVTLMARVRHGDLVVLKELVEARQVCPVIDRQYPLSEVADALRYVGTRRARGKVVISVK
jgi:NADPH:quinone reductase-like Zn-dependent oxidoreductase/SAM-dependent methyltransferase